MQHTTESLEQEASCPFHTDQRENIGRVAALRWVGVGPTFRLANGQRQVYCLRGLVWIRSPGTGRRQRLVQQRPEKTSEPWIGFWYGSRDQSKLLPTWTWFWLVHIPLRSAGNHHVHRPPLRQQFGQAQLVRHPVSFFGPCLGIQNHDEYPEEEENQRWKVCLAV